MKQKVITFSLRCFIRALYREAELVKEWLKPSCV